MSVSGILSAWLLLKDTRKPHLKMKERFQHRTFHIISLLNRKDSNKTEVEENLQGNASSKNVSQVIVQLKESGVKH